MRIAVNSGRRRDRNHVRHVRYHLRPDQRRDERARDQHDLSGESNQSRPDALRRWAFSKICGLKHQRSPFAALYGHTSPVKRDRGVSTSAGLLPLSKIDTGTRE
jgi:hypothetical protein